MTTTSSHGTMARHWELLKNLPSRGAGKTAKELTDCLMTAGYDVSKRQVERDLLELSTIFPLYCNDSGKPYGWRWADNASMDLPGLTVADALSLKLVEASLQPLLPPSITAALMPRFREAEKKLAALETANVNARWTHKVRSVCPGLTLAKAFVEPSVLEAVQESLLFNEQVEIDYLAGNGKETSSLILHPLALVTRGPATYLVASAFDYTDVRRYAMHRIVSAKRLHLEAVRPQDFNIDAYLRAGGMQFGEGLPIQLEARVSESLALILRETPLAENQLLSEESGRFRLEATCLDSWQLRWWVLSQANQIEIVHPVELREEILASLKAAVALYA